MATAIKPLALSSSLNPRFHVFTKQTPSRLFLSIQTPKSIRVIAALTMAVTKVVLQRLSNPVIGDALRTGGSLFFAASSLRARPSGYLNTPLTKWLDIYSGVLMIRVLLSWFPNIYEMVLSAIRDLCDPYLNLFRNIIPPIFYTLDVSPLLAFAVLGVLASIVHGSVG